jgi:hypothetical protein
MPAKSEQVFNRFKQRGKDKPYRSREQLRALRLVKELTLIYSEQYPNGLPHNSLGVKYARYMVRTLAFFETIERRERWLDRYTPWMDADKRAAILNMSPHCYSKKSLGQHLELYDEDRERLGIRTIEAVDVSEEQREAINAGKRLKTQERRRRRNNIKPREQYLESVKGPEPWLALKISKATYYRRGLHKQEQGETGSDTHLSSISFTPRLTVSVSDTTEPASATRDMPSDTNVVPFPAPSSQAANQASVAGTNNMLAWQPMRTDLCNGIYADTGGLGRYVIKTGDFIVLKHNSLEMRKFYSRDEAMAYAQQAYESLLRRDNDFQMMPDMLEAA